MTLLVAADFAAFYVFVHHAFVANVIVVIPDYIVYSTTVDCIDISSPLVSTPLVSLQFDRP
jgi:hypothetical protein